MVLNIRIKHWTSLDLAKKYSATIRLVNVFQVPMVGYLGEPFAYLTLLAEFTNEVKRMHEQILSKALKKLKSLRPNLKISTVLGEGRPSDK